MMNCDHNNTCTAGAENHNILTMYCSLLWFVLIGRLLFFASLRPSFRLTCAVMMLLPMKAVTFQRGTAVQTMTPMTPMRPRATHTI